MSTADKTIVAALVAGLLLAACNQGPGTPAPAWAPPEWLHGTWTWDNSAVGTGSFTLTASARNVVVNTAGGAGLTFTADAAQIAADGVATIEHEATIYHGVQAVYRGQQGRRYYWIDFQGAALAFAFFRASASTVDAYMWTPGSGTVGPFELAKE